MTVLLWLSYRLQSWWLLSIFDHNHFQSHFITTALSVTLQISIKEIVFSNPDNTYQVWTNTTYNDNSWIYIFETSHDSIPTLCNSHDSPMQLTALYARIHVPSQSVSTWAVCAETNPRGHVVGNVIRVACDDNDIAIHITHRRFCMTALSVWDGILLCGIDELIQNVGQSVIYFWHKNVK